MSRPALLSDRAYNAIKQEILGGVLEPGEQLQEGELARRFSVSKTPVRDALNRLVHEGLLDVFARVGYVVTDCTVEESRSIFEFRAILEGAAVELAARYMTDSELEQLDAMAHLDARPRQRATYQEFFAQNRRFHLLIASASRNSQLAYAIEGLFDRVDRLLHYRLDVGDEDSALAVMRDEHLSVVDALRRRDPQLARAVLMEGLDRTRSQVLGALIMTEDSNVQRSAARVITQSWRRRAAPAPAPASER